MPRSTNTSSSFTGYVKIFPDWGQSLTRISIARSWTLPLVSWTLFDQETWDKSRSTAIWMKFVPNQGSSDNYRMKFYRPNSCRRSLQLKLDKNYRASVETISGNGKFKNWKITTILSIRWSTTLITACKRQGPKGWWRSSGTKIAVIGKLTLNWMRKWSSGLRKSDGMAFDKYMCSLMYVNIWRNIYQVNHFQISFIISCLLPLLQHSSLKQCWGPRAS